jgi:hypothetical protein
MANESKQVPPVDAAAMLLIVVGAHLRAEIADRPLAYLLQKRIGRWVEEHRHQLDVAIHPIVCSDIWYLNQPQLQVRPTISVGGPGVNALSAFYAQKLANVLSEDDRMVIQLDLDFVDLRACAWGVDHQTTIQVAQVFMSRFLDDFMRAVATQVEPEVD